MGLAKGSEFDLLKNYEGVVRIKVVGIGYSQEDFYSAIVKKLEGDRWVKDETIVEEHVEGKKLPTLIIAVKSVGISAEEKD